MKIKGHTIKGHMAYFNSDQDSIKGKDPNIHIIDGIHSIKGKTYINVLISNYTNKHVTFNKGEYVGHLELPIGEVMFCHALYDDKYLMYLFLLVYS